MIVIVVHVLLGLGDTAPASSLPWSPTKFNLPPTFLNVASIADALRVRGSCLERHDEFVYAAQIRDRQGMNRQNQAGTRVEPKMHVVDHRVFSTLMPRDDGLHGTAAAAQMSSAVRNELRKAETTSSTSIVLVKDKKVVLYRDLSCTCIMGR